MHIAQISTDYRPLIHQTVLDLCVTGVQIEELERVSLLTLLLDESLSIENLVQLPVELISIRLELIRLRPHMLIDIIESVHQNLVYLFSDLHRILFDMLHFCHDLL